MLTVFQSGAPISTRCSVGGPYHPQHTYGSLFSLGMASLEGYNQQDVDIHFAHSCIDTQRGIYFKRLAGTIVQAVSSEDL